MSDIIIMLSGKHLKKGLLCIRCMKEFVSDCSISVVTEKELSDEMVSAGAKFIDENLLIDKNEFLNDFELHGGNPSKRGCWYYQQFLKMQYSRICEKDHYIIWDGDTIPLSDIKFISDEGKLLFNRKSEHHIPYFTTMKRLIPDIDFDNNGSFISEYMPVYTQIMNEIMDKLGGEDRLKWYINILNNIDQSDMDKAGFSEYETYGNYMHTFYPDKYSNISIKTCRDGRRLFGGIPSFDDVIRYVGKCDTITIEG